MNPLFRIHLADLFEHPPDLTRNAAEIPNGPVEGWDVYAPDWEGDRKGSIGPVPAVVSRARPDGSPYIVIDTPGTGQNTKYWFGGAGGNPFDPPERPCWYQSGMMLRFVRKK